MRKDHERLTREALESMRDRYESDISALREGHGMETRRLREGMEEANPKAGKAKTEAEMTAMAVDVNEAPKGEDPSGPRGCDRKDEKEPETMTVEWGAGLLYPPPQRGRE